MPKYITYEQLIHAEACEGQLDLFRRRFGTMTRVDPSLAVSVAHVFSFGWAAENLLCSDGYQEYARAIAPHRKACDEVVAPHLSTYRETVAHYREVYRETVAHFIDLPLDEYRAYAHEDEEAWAIYKERELRANKICEEATAPHMEAYKEAVASTFAEVYLSQPEGWR